jgi:ParB-like chromosome segregation protein Spo0J
LGFNVPILVDAELKVIAGHGRLLACNLLGRKEVPTINLEHLPAYVDTAIRRWQALTGERARHAGSGRLFEENHPEIGAAA